MPTAPTSAAPFPATKPLAAPVNSAIGAEGLLVAVVTALAVRVLAVAVTVATAATVFSNSGVVV